MTWFYRQRTGEILHDHISFGYGYSGYGADKNRPESQSDHGSGPIPRGTWHIDGHHDSQNTGPFSIILFPDVTTATFRRGDFRIHGDSISSPGNASHGCIILSRPIREQIWASGDRTLEVTE